MHVISEFTQTGDEKILIRRLKSKDSLYLAQVFDHPLTEKQAAELLSSSVHAWQADTEYILGVIAREDDTLKGLIELYEYTGTSVMIGYRIAPGQRNMGYGGEAVYVLVRWLMSQTEITEVYAAVEKGNTWSVRLLKHNGFEEEEEKDGRLLFVYHRRDEKQEVYETPAGRKTIYLAAGCFWGAEKAFRMLEGVTDTAAGYANGEGDHPHYEDVCRGQSGYRETVRVTYDPSQITLSRLLKAFFLCIHPEEKNRQAEDIGTQYQTGVYYTDEEDRPVIAAIFEEEKNRHTAFYTELLPLKNFYEAETYHQKYLDRHPAGYCHITAAVFDQIKTLNHSEKGNGI